MLYPEPLRACFDLKPAVFGAVNTAAGSAGATRQAAGSSKVSNADTFWGICQGRAGAR